jgi:hypothetical protein
VTPIKSAPSHLQVILRLSIPHNAGPRFSSTVGFPKADRVSTTVLTGALDDRIRVRRPARRREASILRFAAPVCDQRSYDRGTDYRV